MWRLFLILFNVIVLTLTYGFPTKAEDSYDNEYCMVEAVYFEGRGEPAIGQLAIANVILNRVKSPEYPNEACLVVRDCQFSYYCDGKHERMADKEAIRKAERIVFFALDSAVAGDVEGAMFYHADYVRPYWADKFQYLGQIGRHKFYKD